jgi:hypothetical protein
MSTILAQAITLTEQRESILARPIKLASLYNALIPAGDADTPNRARMQGRSRGSADKVNKKLALVCVTDSVICYIHG